MMRYGTKRVRKWKYKNKMKYNNNEEISILECSISLLVDT